MQPKRILIVEDEPRIALALCRALEFPPSNKRCVEISPVAETALSKIRSKAYDLIITDLRMPGMSGAEFLRQVHDLCPGTPTMLITGFGSPEVEDLARRLGAVYMSKPFSLRCFVEQVDEIITADQEKKHNIPAHRNGRGR
jgi:DNA-binding NtrC family response regulator